MRKRKIAVIGGAGFIGQSLCRLLSKDNLVLNIDIKKITGQNIKNVITDIRNEKKLLKVLKFI